LAGVGHTETLGLKEVW